MQPSRFIALLATACILSACCEPASHSSKSAAAEMGAKPGAISADAKTILKDATAAAQADKSIPAAKRKTTALNSLYAYHSQIAAYEGLKIPQSSIRTGNHAVDVALWSITSNKTPVTAKDVAAAKQAVVLAGGTP
jgi:hypothetical protein